MLKVNVSPKLNDITKMENGDEIWQNPERISNMLRSEEKMTRKIAHELVWTQVEKAFLQGPNIEKNIVENGDKNVMFFFYDLIPSLTDQVERCRETAFKTLTLIVNSLPTESYIKFLPTIVTILADRFGEDEMHEESEEVRLLAVQFIQALVFKLDKNDVSIFLDDFTLILCYTIVDPYNMVRLESSTLLSAVARKDPEQFHFLSERLVRPLCKAVTHQQFKVRVAILQCIENFVHFGNHKNVNDMVPTLICRLFDSNPLVRKTLVKVVGQWMLTFVDRYSFFPKFIPFIMTGLCDESPDVKNTSDDFWNRIGQQYLEENIEEYKNETDFPVQFPIHYPPTVKRFNLGCRALSAKNLHCLLPGIINDLCDWTVTTRIKSAQLLYTLVLHSEEKTVMHSEKIINCLYRAFYDDDDEVIKYVLLISELIGYFVPLTVTFPILSIGITSSGKDAPFAILANILKGTEKKQLDTQAKDILQLISPSEVLQTFSFPKQTWLLHICDTLIEKITTPNLEEISKELFLVLMTIRGMSQGFANVQESLRLMKRLKEELNYPSVEALIGEFSKDILEKMKIGSSEWAPISPEKLIFQSIVIEGGFTNEVTMELILDLMISNLTPNKDSDVRLKFFTLLSENFTTMKVKMNEGLKERIQIFVQHIVEDILNPSLVWKAGRAAGALRTAATSCLYAILREELLEKETLLHLSKELLPSLIGLMDDSSDLTRVLVLQNISQILILLPHRLDAIILHKIYPCLLKRLDDTRNEIRMESCEGLVSLFTGLPPDYDINLNKAHLEYVYSILLVHLDDRDEEIQNIIHDSLMKIGTVAPELLLKECKKTGKKLRCPELAEQIAEKFQQ